MKQLLLLVAVLISTGAHAQKYKDSLYAEYKNAYWNDRMAEYKYTNSLFRAAEQVFSVKNPVMRYAIKESKLSDSAAISILGYETMGCFLDDKFLPWAVEHFDTDMLPILEVYSDEICGRITARMKAYGKIPREAVAKKLEQATMEASIDAAKSQSFLEKTAKLRAEVGTDMVMHSVSNQEQYMYVHCMYLRKYIMNGCIDNAIEKYKAFKLEEEERMLMEFWKYANGESAEKPDVFFLTKPEWVETAGFLLQISKKMAALTGTRDELMYYTIPDKDKRRIIYYFDNGTPGQAQVLGEIKATVLWTGGRIHLTKMKWINADKITDKATLLRNAVMGDIPPEMVELKN